MPRASTALDRLVRPGPNLWERSPDRDSNLPTIQCPGIAAIGRQVALGKRSHQAPTVGAVSRPRLKPPNDPMSRHCGNRLASRAWKALPPSLRLWERSPDRDSNLPTIQCPGIAAIDQQVALGKRSHRGTSNHWQWAGRNWAGKVPPLHSHTIGPPPLLVGRRIKVWPSPTNWL